MDFFEQKKLLDKQKFLNLYLKRGYNATSAAMEVYKCSSRAVASIKGNRLLKELDMGNMMENVGVTDKSLMKHFKSGLKAKKYVVPTAHTAKSKIKKNGYVTVPDYAVRNQFLQLVLKMKGKMNEGANVQINNFMPLLGGKTKNEGKEIIQEGEIVNGSIHGNNSNKKVAEIKKKN